jgi:tRNA(His) 5'-end guanylyltransferase
MRVYETAHDHCVLPGLFMVVRLDGRGFTRLTRQIHGFAAPFDARFRDLMLDTAEHLMSGCGFHVVYTHTHSDEISLLLGRDDETFGRKLRKIVSVLAGEASARFSLALGAHAAFDGRVAQLPDETAVRRYFRWRQEDSRRNALSAHCYWLMRSQGSSERQAAVFLKGRDASSKHELLARNGVRFEALPAWESRGVALLWETYEKLGVDPRSGETRAALRRRIRRELELPEGEAYDTLVASILGVARVEDAPGR